MDDRCNETTRRALAQKVRVCMMDRHVKKNVRDYILQQWSGMAGVGCIILDYMRPHHDKFLGLIAHVHRYDGRNLNWNLNWNQITFDSNDHALLQIIYMVDRTDRDFGMTYDSIVVWYNATDERWIHPYPAKVVEYLCEYSPERANQHHKILEKIGVPFVDHSP